VDYSLNYLIHKVIITPLFSGKELAKNWKFSGQIVKDYDQFLKNYTTNLINGGSSKIQIPPNEKITLGIVQGYIVFQIYVFSLKSFSIEIFISDTSKVINI